MAALRIQVYEFAGDDTLFADNSFSRVIGKEMPVTADGIEFGLATLVSAVVVQGGKAALLTLDCSAEVASLFD